MSVQIRGRQILDSTITAAKLVLSDDFTFSGAVSVATPTADAHAANKGYVDAQLQGLSPKQAVRVLTKVNVDISSAPAAIDGVTMANKDRVVLTNQSTATENGIYTYASSGSAMSRASDADTFAKLQSAYFFVKEGTSADEGFVQTTELSSFAGQSYVQFSSAGNIVAGDGLAKSGNTLSVNVDGSSLEINSDALRVKASGITDSMLAGNISNAKLANSAISIAGSSISLGGSITADAIAGAISAGTITNAQLAGSIANAKLANSSVSLGGVSVALGASDATPAFDLADATNYPTSSLVGTITNAQLAGSIANGKLSNSSVSLGGVSVALGGSDATPAFDLADATNYPTSSLVGTITNAQLAGSIANAKLANSAITIAGASTALGGSITADAIAGAISAGGIAGAKLADGGVTLDKLSFSGKFKRVAAADGSTTTIDLDDAVDLDFKKFFSVAVNGLLMEYKDTPNAQDNYKIDNTGAGSVGRVTFGAALTNGDVVTVRYIA